MAPSTINKRRPESQDPEDEEEATHRRRGAIPLGPDTFKVHRKGYTESFFLYGGQEHAEHEAPKPLTSNRFTSNLLRSYGTVAVKLNAYRESEDYEHLLEENGIILDGNGGQCKQYHPWGNHPIHKEKALAFGLRYSLGQFHGHKEIQRLDRLTIELRDDDDRAKDNRMLEVAGNFADQFKVTIPARHTQETTQRANIPISCSLSSGISSLQEKTGLFRDSTALLLLYNTLSQLEGICKRDHVEQAQEIMDQFFDHLACRNDMLEVALDWAYGRRGNVVKGKFSK